MEKRIIFFWIAGFFLPEINATVFSEEGGNGNSITQKEYGPHAPYPALAHCGRSSGNNYSSKMHLFHKN